MKNKREIIESEVKEVILDKPIKKERDRTILHLEARLRREKDILEKGYQNWMWQTIFRYRTLIDCVIDSGGNVNGLDCFYEEDKKSNEKEYIVWEERFKAFYKKCIEEVKYFWEEVEEYEKREGKTKTGVPIVNGFPNYFLSGK